MSLYPARRLAVEARCLDERPRQLHVEIVAGGQTRALATEVVRAGEPVVAGWRP